MSAFNHSDVLSSNISTDELLSQWTDGTDYTVNDPLSGPFGSETQDEPQATCGATDPDRVGPQSGRRGIAPAAPLSWSYEPVPYVPDLSNHSLAQTQTDPSLFYNPPESPQATLGAQDPDFANRQPYESRYPKLPSLTTGAWRPFAYIHDAAAPTPSEIPIDPALLAEDTLTVANDLCSSLPASASPSWTPASASPTRSSSSSTTTSPTSPPKRSSKRKRPTASVTPALISKRPKRAPKPISAQAPPPLPAPLSLLTASSPLPLKDIPAFIHRPASERHAEAAAKARCGKTKGAVPRPLNSFILYRSAYAERINEYVSITAQKGDCGGVNHQNVSRLAGESWRVEREEVRRLFEAYARVEKGEHAKAWPGYKYKPVQRGRRDEGGVD